MEKWIETSEGKLLNLCRVDFLEVVAINTTRAAFELRAALAGTGMRMKVTDGTEEKCQAIKLVLKVGLDIITWK